MPDIPSPKNQNNLPQPNLLRWEIGIALCIKVVLLTGLWFLIYNWPDKAIDKSSISEHFALPATQITKTSAIAYSTY